MSISHLTRDTLRNLIGDQLSNQENEWMWSCLHIPHLSSPANNENTTSRAEIAFALALRLLAELVRRVPESTLYIERIQKHQQNLIFDHGALRTVDWFSGQLPRGEASFTRFLTALGYTHAATYPLTRLKMTGRSYAHEDFPEDIPQYFVSELHPDRFSSDFQQAVSRVVGTSRDPLSPDDIALIEQLRRDKSLPIEQAKQLIVSLAGCFDRQHEPITVEDYALLKNESAEMAWIATEGNAFNHATDRVENVLTLSEELRKEGFTIKDTIEISQTKRVRQTAIKATQVERPFKQNENNINMTVPGSFFEFISRDFFEENGITKLDLAFDASNATGIFKMTEATAC
ncbi:MAG: DUF1338 family protein [Pseudomonadota bacterium]